MATIPADLNAAVPTDTDLVSNADNEFRALKAAHNAILQYLRDQVAEGIGQVPAGSMIFSFASSMLGNYIPLVGAVALGKTAPNVSPGTQYIGTDYQAAYNALWQSINPKFTGNAYLPEAARTAVFMVDNNNQAVAKSANALTDWDANRLIVVNFSGLNIGLAGGSNCADLAIPVSTYDSGTIRGKDTHILTVDELAPHTHTFPGHQIPVPGGAHGGSREALGDSTRATNSTGLGTAHNNLSTTVYLYGHLKY